MKTAKEALQEIRTHFWLKSGIEGRDPTIVDPYAEDLYIIEKALEERSDAFRHYLDDPSQVPIRIIADEMVTEDPILGAILPPKRWNRGKVVVLGANGEIIDGFEIDIEENALPKLMALIRRKYGNFARYMTLRYDLKGDKHF